MKRFLQRAIAVLTAIGIAAPGPSFAAPRARNFDRLSDRSSFDAAKGSLDLGTAPGSLEIDTSLLDQDQAPSIGRLPAEDLTSLRSNLPRSTVEEPLEKSAPEKNRSSLAVLAVRQQAATKSLSDSTSAESNRNATDGVFEPSRWLGPASAIALATGGLVATAFGDPHSAAHAPMLAMAALGAGVAAPRPPAGPPNVDGVHAVGRALFAEARRRSRWRFEVSPVRFASDRVIALASKDEFTKIQLLKFTGLLPNIYRDDRKIVQNLREYFADPRVLPAVRWPALAAARIAEWPLVGPLAVWATGRSTVFLVRKLIAKRFFVGERTDEALAVIRQLKSKDRNVTVDILGEKSLSQADTDAYVGQYLALLDRGVDNVSIKLTNLYSEFNPNAPEATKTAVKRELRKIIAKAKEKGASVTIDMEHYTVKDLTLEIYLEMLQEEAAKPDPFQDLSIAIQNYIKDETPRDLRRIVETARRLHLRPGVRLVKGANWDRDVAEHLQKGWDVPHYLRKAETDANYEANARYLLANSGAVRPAFGTHNLRTIAVIMAAARELGVGPDRFEFQHLYGMIPEEVVSTIQAWGYRVRYYTPYGDLIPGLGYLVRRILENSANDSFLRQLSYDDATAERLLRDPRELLTQTAVPAASEPEADASPNDVLARIIDTDPEVTAVFDRSLAQMRELRIAARLAVRSLPGMKNEFVYGPRGGGMVIIEDPSASLSEIAERLAAPLVAGNKLYVSIADRRAQSHFKDLFLSSGLLGTRVEFLEASPAMNEQYVRRRDLEWVSYLGPAARARVLRRASFEDLAKQRSVKRFVDRVEPDHLLQFVQAKSIAENTMRAGFAESLSITGGLAGFENAAPVELHRAANRARFERALAAHREEPVTPATPEQARAAIASAKAAQSNWAALGVAERARLLRRTAEILHDRRFELAALVTIESHKNAESALADVDEAVDFLKYYASDSLRLEREDQVLTSEPRWSGWRRVPRGVTAVIAPWNFPLAILTGMAAGALATGNTVLLKPAEQTPMTGRALARAFAQAGLPSGVVQFVPGDGEIGKLLAGDPDVDMVAFTGSEPVGLAIKGAAESEQRGDRAPKGVIAEMGGKNAIIVDETADIDEAVEGVIQSMLGFSGQKCSAASRVILLPGAREAFERRLKAKFDSIVAAEAGDPAALAVPLIDEAARAKVRRYLRIAKQEGLQVLAERHEPKLGLDMAIYRSVPRASRLAHEEIFGPVLVLLNARNMDDALMLANNTPFALTGGIYSQTPSVVERVKHELRVGNLYINRNITGAIVGQQPFGGSGHSGIGAHAGGPDYLPQFTVWQAP